MQQQSSKGDHAIKHAVLCSRNQGRIGGLIQRYVFLSADTTFDLFTTCNSNLVNVLSFFHTVIEHSSAFNVQFYCILFPCASQ